MFTEGSPKTDAVSGSSIANTLDGPRVTFNADLEHVHYTFSSTAYDRRSYATSTPITDTGVNYTVLF